MKTEILTAHTDTSRRQFLTTALSLAVTGCVLPNEGRNLVNPALNPFGPLRILHELKDDAVFTEGPAFGPDRALYFTNIPANRILRLDPITGNLTIFREDSDGANGLTFHPNGDLLVCESTTGTISAIDITNGHRRVLADQYRGKPISDVNDLTLDASGRLYFSSRPQHFDPATGNVNGVYRLDPDGNIEQILAWPDTDMPNGVAISPDQTSFYLIDADGKENRRRQLDRFDLTPDGRLENRTRLHNFYPGRSGDGMCLDRSGNLFVAAGLHALRNSSETLDTQPGIHVFSPTGAPLAYLETPVDTITNCTFGTHEFADTLFITCGPLILSADVDPSALA